MENVNKYLLGALLCLSLAVKCIIENNENLLNEIKVIEIDTDEIINNEQDN